MKPLVLAGVLAALIPLARGADFSATVARLQAAGSYELANPPKAKGTASTTGWVQGAFYTGLSAFDRSGLAGAPFDGALMAIGEGNGWRLGRRMYHADDECVGQMYLDLYDTHRDPRMLAAMKERCDSIMAHPKTGSLAFEGSGKNDQWSWCDSLYMGPPGWAHLARITGNRAYLDYASGHWWRTSDYLYDPSERLFYRDSTYFGRHEANGRKIFWGRGNGWVMAGLAHMLEQMPSDYPARPRFVRQFQDMAGRLRQLQQADGSWASSLLDPKDCRPSGETSGTGFYCFAFAWGVNRGLLDAAAFTPAARKAFAFLRSCEEPSGRVNHVQPVGAAPTQFSPDSTEAYGVGAYLLAGVEVVRMEGASK